MSRDEYTRLAPYTPRTEPMTQEQLAKLASYWQRVLRIQDWDIDILLCSGDDIGDKNGESLWTATKRRASIRLRNAAHVGKGWDPIDPEQVLVHEMLHVVLADLDDLARDETEDDPLNTAIERVIDSMAWSLVLLRRGEIKGKAVDE